MTSSRNDDLLNRVQTIRVNSRYGRRPPHKPLLLLLSIGRHLNGHGRLATFGDIERDLNRLIRRFGLPDSRENAYHPFWHLRNDGLRQIDRPELVRTTAAYWEVPTYLTCVKWYSKLTRAGAPSASWMCRSTDSRSGLRPPTLNGTPPGDLRKSRME